MADEEMKTLMVTNTNAILAMCEVNKKVVTALEGVEKRLALPPSPVVWWRVVALSAVVSSCVAGVAWAIA
jgi:hypothetical protein